MRRVKASPRREPRSSRGSSSGRGAAARRQRDARAGWAPSRTTSSWARSPTSTVRSSVCTGNRSSFEPRHRHDSREDARLLIAIRISKATTRKPRPKDGELVFGPTFTDHMAVADCERSAAGSTRASFRTGRSRSIPAAAVFHYAQEMFDGLKAFRGADGKIRFFRLDRHGERMHDGARGSASRRSTRTLARGARRARPRRRDWVPSPPGTSLYIRPTIIATEPFLGVRPAKRYLFFVILVAGRRLLRRGLQPGEILVEDKYVRAAAGGLGGVKAGANYTASLLAAEDAKARGYAQVLWTDAVDHTYLEEVGTMNLFVAHRRRVRHAAARRQHPRRRHARLGAHAAARLGLPRQRAADRHGGADRGRTAPARCARCSAAAPPRSSRRSARSAGRARTSSINDGAARRGVPAALRRDHRHPVRARRPTRTAGPSRSWAGGEAPERGAPTWIACSARSGTGRSPRSIYDDDLTLAFMDINPLNSGHCLVITKAHAATI